MNVIDCGIIGFHEALSLQEGLAARIATGCGEETLLLLEHPSVYTIGRGGDYTNILSDTVTAERINRGGDVTWHGPGQVVGYPLVNLGRRGRDLHLWLRLLEEVLIASLAAFGVRSRRSHGSTGVWAEHGKIAFIGVGVRRWVTMHGFCLNVRPDLRVYDKINPCGLSGCPVTSMARELGGVPPAEEIKAEFTKNFMQHFSERMPYEIAIDVPKV